MTLWDGLYRTSMTFPASGGNSHLRTCPTCNGTGINPMWITKVCPKCHGEKKIARV